MNARQAGLARKGRGLLGLASLLMALLVACGEPSPAPTPPPEPTEAVAAAFASDPTATRTPTTTPTPERTAVLTPTPAATPEPTASPTPTSAATPGPTASPTPEVTATPEPTASPTPTPTSSPEVPTAAPTSVVAEVTVAVSEATMSFPEAINFRLDASSALPLRKVDLELGTDRVYSCSTRGYASVRLDFEPDSQVDLSWDWEMKKTGSIAPGSTVWWRWRFEDEQGRAYVSPTRELTWQDDRFQWQSFVQDNITLHWYAGGSDFGKELGQAVADGLASLELGRELVRPIRAFVYASSEDVLGAILFAQEWTGGLAFGFYNVLLIGISPERPQEEVDGLVHELAHLLVQELTFNCFGDLPTWLDEGLATYAEGPLAGYQQSTLDEAIAADNLITVRSLSSSFPAARGGASLSYAQSQSLVQYLIDAYGWAKMRELLKIFQEGSTYDEALLRAYGIDMAGLNQEWREHIGAR